MNQQVIEKLKKIEQTENIRILHAIESGSRAWGFASEDSDFDVRFLYIRSSEQYLLLEKTRDVLEYPVDTVWDINGWDLQKALRLLHCCNTTLIEWLNSPIVYQSCAEIEDIRILAKQSFQPRAGVYHYLHTAVKTWKKQLQTEQVKAKKYFYVLRPVLACLWILDYQTPPPVSFFDLTQSHLPSYLTQTVNHLVTLKQTLSEKDRISHIPQLDAFLLNQIEIISHAVQNLPPTKKISWKPFNHIFQKLLYCNTSKVVHQFNTPLSQTHFIQAFNK